MKISCKRAIFFLSLINPILSLVFDNTSVYYFYIMGPVIFLLLLYHNCKTCVYTRVSLYVTIVTFISVLLAIAYGVSRSGIGKINNHLFNFLDAVLLMLMLSHDDNIDYFRGLFKSKIFLAKLIVIITNIVELFLLITRRGYEYHYSWGGTFFHGTNSMPHTLAYLMQAIIVLDCLIIQYSGKKWFGLFCIIPFYTIFESGSRTSLVLSIFLLLVIIDLVFTQKQKSVVLKLLFVVIFAGVFLFVFRDKILTSDMINKILLRQSSGNDTAGRTYIWTNLMHEYLTSYNPLKYFFGQGDYMTYYYNLANPDVNVNVWAHNDFLQILIGKGMAGFLFYLYAMIKCFKNIIVKNRSVYKYAPICMVVLAALVNGFYSYRDLMLSLPFIVILSRYYDNGRPAGEKRSKKNALRRNW